MALPPIPCLPIQTDRLKIAALHQEDADALQRMTNDRSITDAIDFLPYPFFHADAERLLSGASTDCYLGLWAATQLAGLVGLHPRGPTSVEIGYWLGVDFQGQGLAAEALTAILAALRQPNPDLTIVAECRPENQASRRLLDKLDFHVTNMAGKRQGRRIYLLAAEPSGSTAYTFPQE